MKIFLHCLNRLIVRIICIYNKEYNSYPEKHFPQPKRRLMEKKILIENILHLKKEKDALILAHFYQIPEIQDLADFLGDSLNLAAQAQKTDKKMIVFCGVHFMAETAKILNPDKKVVLPDINAGCSLADSCGAEEFSAFKEKYPNHMVISYINCSAEIKKLSDIICTSGNAVQLVNSLPKNQEIIFAPDKNLGGYINHVTGRNMVLWNGSCEVHDQLTAERVLLLKKNHPEGVVIAHPECNQAVLEVADFIGSTAAMISFVNKSKKGQKFIVATETGIVHSLQQNNPDKEFLVVTSQESCACNDCRHMKLNTLEKLYECMKNESPEIILEEELMESAKKPIVRMLDLSKSLGILK